ncbi:MAG: guanylate kinase [Thermodesulfobacteriota bacterium]
MTEEIYIVSAPSGAGKTTLLKRLLAADPGLRFSISYTTRPPRTQETHGREYFFVTQEEFLRLREQGALLEWVEQFGHFYGTSRDYVAQSLVEGYGIVFDLDVRGAKALKKKFPYATFIFILPPSLEILEQRLEDRGELSPEELARRLEQGRGEVGEAHWYDYLVVNEHLDEALAELQAVIRANRCRTPRVWPRLASRFGF